MHWPDLVPHRPHSRPLLCFPNPIHELPPSSASHAEHYWRDAYLTVSGLRVVSRRDGDQQRVMHKLEVELFENWT